MVTYNSLLQSVSTLDGGRPVGMAKVPLPDSVVVVAIP